MQATLYAQVRTLKLDLEQRYGITLSVTSPIYSWLLRHAQWLMNRYLQKADGLSAYEKRCGRKYVGETAQFRKPSIPKAEPSFTFGIWLGRCTESDVRFVADSSGVFKTRSVRRLVPDKRMDQQVLLSMQATPWDPKGTKRETDQFILPGNCQPPAPPQSEGATSPRANFGRTHSRNACSGTAHFGHRGHFDCTVTSR